MRALIAALLVASLPQYDRITALLSEPVETRWTRFGSVYFRTNERLLNRFYPRFENTGGVIVGVSFQQNFSLLVHSRPELCVIFDINPAVTEILTPFIGELMAQSPDRREFVSKLLAVEAGAGEVKRLLESDSGAIYADLVKKTRPEERERLRRSWRATMEKILDRLPLDPRNRSDVMNWQNILDQEEYSTGEFFRDATLSNGRKEMAGWLSTEANYQLVRKYWMEGRIVGVTGDIGGPGVARLAAWLRSSNKQVSVIYLSDVGTALTGPGTPAHFLRLYETLGELPLRPDARVLISHGGALTAYARNYAEAVWLYRFLADVDYSTFFRLNQNVLQSVTADGMLYPSFRQELQKLAADKARRNEPLPEEAIRLYSQLLDRVETDKAKVKTLDLAGFTRWARQSFPSLETTGPIFRTIAATLVESGALRARQPL